ncbi:hypothetical protein NL676_008026 [Syzygium grande]|nr:hypothetical protein NL676_008026 [Syzygium grande]
MAPSCQFWYETNDRFFDPVGEPLPPGKSNKSTMITIAITVPLGEIICGKKNNFYHQLNGGEYLASYVWNQWRDGKPLEVLDPAIVDSYSREEVIRCLHICLLCIQEDPAIRPTMATVVLILSSNSITSPSPRHPAFYVQSRLRGLSIPVEELESDQSTRRTMPSSTNGMSVTELYPGEWQCEQNLSSWVVSQ